MPNPVPDHFMRLREIIRSYGKLAVAFSGGVDSICLVKIASETLPRENLLAITVNAVNFTPDEIDRAHALACEWDILHLIIDWDPFAISQFVDNPVDRCYYCKKSLFGAIQTAANEAGFSTLADGANLDDLSDYRPGERAARELGVVSPLREAGLAKAEIRRYLAVAGISGHDYPANACLASRVPYGHAIDVDLLATIAASEAFFRRHGLQSVRVRCHGDLARVELSDADRTVFIAKNLWEEADQWLRKQGFAYAALDLAGYRRGSLNPPGA